MDVRSVPLMVFWVAILIFEMMWNNKLNYEGIFVTFVSSSN